MDNGWEVINIHCKLFIVLNFKVLLYVERNVTHHNTTLYLLEVSLLFCTLLLPRTGWRLLNCISRSSLNMAL